jgi:dTDP-4-dehydrorhamnose reductase
MKVLIIGATGMLGNAMFRFLSADPNLFVFATVRSESSAKNFPSPLSEHLIAGIDVESYDSLVQVFADVRPDVVVNCVGLVKQLAESNEPLRVVPINTLLPHRLASLCQAINGRLIHISTDCVFSGQKGNYLESDFPDADDLYGRTKLLGEVNYSHTITLRTSIIGHELSGHRSLVGWFLAQERPVKGFKRAIFSGLPTVELARVVRDFVLPREELHGLYHVAAKPINKFDLLNLISKTYEKTIEIAPDEETVIDRSLNASRFENATGYIAPDWPELIQRMHDFR